MPSVRSKRFRRAPRPPRPPGPPRRKIRWTRLLLLLAILATIFTSLCWGAVQVYQHISSLRAVSSTSTVSPTVSPTVSRTIENTKPSEPVSKFTNILLLGVDDGESEKLGGTQRSDVMMVISINSENGSVNLLSIPRDTRVAIPGHKGTEKINHAFSYGGSELAIRTVEDLLQLHINQFVVINWQAFIKVIDQLGGVDLYVENNMNYEDPYADVAIHLNQGYQHLNGSEVGQYVRFRSDELGDINRVERQQRVVKALADQNLQVGNIFKMIRLISSGDQYVTTDISGFKMFKLVKSLKSFSMNSLEMELLPGKLDTVDGVNYWKHDQEQTQQLVERIVMSDNTTTSNIATP